MGTLLLSLLAACRAPAIPPMDPATSPTEPVTFTVPCEASTTVDLGIVPPEPIESDTGDYAPSCPAYVRKVPLSLCIETTGPILPDPAGAVPLIYAGTAEIVAVGTDLPPVADSRSLGEYLGYCESDRRMQARLVDGDGATWTFTWASSDPIAPDPTVNLTVGSAVSFEIDWTATDPADEVYEEELGVVIADDMGPLVIYEDYSPWAGARLSDAHRGGVAITSGTYESCEEHSEAYHDLLHVRWCGGAVALRSGSSFVVPAAGGELELFVLKDGRFGDDCFVGCDRESWVAWRL